MEGTGVEAADSYPSISLGKLWNTMIYPSQREELYRMIQRFYTTLRRLLRRPFGGENVNYVFFQIRNLFRVTTFLR
jgi:hypothetical protein